VRNFKSTSPFAVEGVILNGAGGAVKNPENLCRMGTFWILHRYAPQNDILYTNLRFSRFKVIRRVHLSSFYPNIS
jgi:hypothetical protein